MVHRGWQVRDAPTEVGVNAKARARRGKTAPRRKCNQTKRLSQPASSVPERLQCEQCLYDLPPQRGLISPEALERSVVELGKTDEAMGQSARWVDRCLGRKPSKMRMRRSRSIVISLAAHGSARTMKGFKPASQSASEPSEVPRPSLAPPQAEPDSNRDASGACPSSSLGQFGDTSTSKSRSKNLLSRMNRL
jgi:hypothetical protein